LPVRDVFIVITYSWCYRTFSWHLSDTVTTASIRVCSVPRGGSRSISRPVRQSAIPTSRTKSPQHAGHLYHRKADIRAPAMPALTSPRPDLQSCRARAPGRP
jgi:hypothetical protein